MLLPAELAPNLRAAVEQLISECGLADHPAPRRSSRAQPVCHVCRKPGRMGGHHLADGTVVNVHRSCHRRVHRAGRA